VVEYCSTVAPRKNYDALWRSVFTVSTIIFPFLQLLGGEIMLVMYLCVRDELGLHPTTALTKEFTLFAATTQNQALLLLRDEVGQQ
jgi:hypothetical protein